MNRSRRAAVDCACRAIDNARIEAKGSNEKIASNIAQSNSLLALSHLSNQRLPTFASTLAVASDHFVESPDDIRIRPTRRDIGEG